ncbi:hypothetical protein PROFUN_03339 [Planoprotostelium fungivorum]|uniref:Uncharacterized protein n=1 Tax=Planoprotostelium fungivorum TaxID=1890364 RepID=A0A2P6NWT0_9EUKA|nr:hypothetical protein PROFUN_03339 [Planoprotostelium fungivorum]
MEPFRRSSFLYPFLSCKNASTLKRSVDNLFISLSLGFTRLKEHLSHSNCSLTTLGLWDGSVSVDGAQAIAEALKLNNSINHLYLDRNNIGNEGVLAIVQSLRVNRSISNLHLSRNGITDEGAKAIAEIVQENPSIFLVDLSLNDVKDLRILHQIETRCNYNRNTHPIHKIHTNKASRENELTLYTINIADVERCIDDKTDIIFSVSERINNLDHKEKALTSQLEEQRTQVLDIQSQIQILLEEVDKREKMMETISDEVVGAQREGFRLKQNKERLTREMQIQTEGLEQMKQGMRQMSDRYHNLYSQ